MACLEIAGLDSGTGLIMGDLWRFSNGFDRFHRPFLWVVLGPFLTWSGGHYRDA